MGLKKSGGYREGSGAKPKYNEPTTTIAFRVPVSKVDELKDMVNTKLSEWAVVGQSEQLKTFLIFIQENAPNYRTKQLKPDQVIKAYLESL